MPKRKTPADKIRERLETLSRERLETLSRERLETLSRERLETLSRSIPTNLRLPSLEEKRLEGYAYFFRIVLPLFNSEGERVYTDPILIELFHVLDNRFGGCMVAASSSAPPLWGLWHPAPHSDAEKDYLTTAEVLANPIEASTQFFVGLKPILKTAGHIEQQEILISRIECRLL